MRNEESMSGANNNPPAGWYPDPIQAGQERWWDGQAWTRQAQPVNPAPPPAPAPAPAPAAVAPGGALGPTYAEYATGVNEIPDKKKRSGCFGIATGVMFGIIAAVVLLVGGCAVLLDQADGGDDFELVEPAESDSGADAASGDAGSGAEDGTESDSADAAEPGSRENPLPLGQVHSRPVGFTGTGWDVSIDKVERVGLSPLATSDDTGECLVVSGTATAREVDTEDGLSNIFSFPQVIVVVNGVQVDASDSLFACDGQPSGYEDYLLSIDMSLAEGGTALWVKTYNLREVGAEIDWVAIEQVVYAHQ